MAFSQNALKPALIAQHMRWQRGLLNCEKCSATELRTFATRRGILNKSELRKPPRVVNLAARLEKADDCETFSRFLDLPAELRLRIYGLHFHGFDSDVNALLAPYPAPMTEVNSQLRSESLPVHYSICTFGFDVAQIRRPLYLGDIYYDNRGRSRTSMQKFIHKAPAEQTAMLRKMKIWGKHVEYE